MYYIGIDIAKFKHYASVISSDGEVIIDAFPFPNDISGFNLLISKISKFDKKHLIFGLESTAHYGENIIHFLFNLDFNVAVINPFQTASLRKSNIRITKTDKVDTFLIAKCLSLGSYRLIEKRDIDIIKLKSLCLCRQNLILLRSRAKIQLNTYVDQIFPELNSFFKSGLHINVSYQLLKVHSSPEDIRNLHLTYLSNLLINNSHGRYTKKDAINLKKLAKCSVGISNPILSIQIKQNIEQILLFNTQLSDVELQISNIMTSINSKILTIPGIGPINGAMILSCIGTISRFSKSCQILAFAGLDPSVIQSGTFSAKSSRMSKRGNRMLRYALINASHNVVLNCSIFKNYYDLKRSQGKSHYCALGHVAKKLINIFFTIEKNNVDFVLN